jgi:hypothetical protein
MRDYLEALNTSDPAFPKDKFFPVRDVSYIRPSRYGTIEFRSACSAPIVTDIIEICAWRITQLVAAHHLAKGQTSVIEAIASATDHLTRTAVISPSVSESMVAKIVPRLRRRV